MKCTVERVRADCATHGIDARRGDELTASAATPDFEIRSGEAQRPAPLVTTYYQPAKGVGAAQTRSCGLHVSVQEGIADLRRGDRLPSGADRADHIDGESAWTVGIEWMHSNTFAGIATTAVLGVASPYTGIMWTAGQFVPTTPPQGVITR